MNGKISLTEDALVSAMEPIYLGIFEGIKAYVEGDVRSSGNLNIFAWKPHIDRLWRSAAVNGIAIPYTKEELLQGTIESIKANGFKTNCYIQPRIWPKVGTGRYLASEFHVVIPTWKFDTVLGKDNPSFDDERRYVISSWRRISSDALPPQAKSWANYANSGLAIREAARLGYDGAIFLDRRGFVSEGTGACIMSVREGRVITPPVTASILESVTRGFFIKFIAEDLGMPVEVRDMTRVELYASDEIFFCGTGAEVTPISSVDNIKIGEEYPGPVTRKIAEHYSKILAGGIEKYQYMLEPVE